ncbi:MAG: 5-oxoprolinase subunit PxpB [Halioglobus sp.]
MKLHSAGENSLILYLGNNTSPEVSARVQNAASVIARLLGEDLIDLVPSYASLLIIYDPFRTDHMKVSQQIHAALETQTATAIEEGRTVVLPVYYSAESGDDLEALAKNANLSTQQVIDLHTDGDYRVYAIGFAPGFAYLGEVDERIAAPRLATPRQKVPRGAVAIADRQTAVYPAASPGGWNLIGRCPTRMFNPEATPTMPVRVGDRVKFEAISREHFYDLGGELS